MPKKQEPSKSYQVELSMADYNKMIDNATEDENGTKRLHKDALEVFNKPMTDLEGIQADIKQWKSALKFQFNRVDTPHLTVNAFCHTNKACSVTYKIYRKQLVDKDKDFNTFEVSVFGEHNHTNNSENQQVRGNKRNVIADKIFHEHGGSSHAARLHDLAENGE